MILALGALLKNTVELLHYLLTVWLVVIALEALLEQFRFLMLEKENKSCKLTEISNVRAEEELNN